MPRGRRPRKNKSNENALTTRLIEISMKMDDHIYNNNLITSTAAAGYLQEIATLKLRCLPTNARALQVIEKLTRLMNKILTEDIRDNTSSFNQFTTQFTVSSSKVYSLPDEDRHIISQLNYAEDENLALTDDDDNNKEVDIPNRQTVNTPQLQDNIIPGLNAYAADINLTYITDICNRQTITVNTPQLQDNIIPGLDYAENVNLTHVTDKIDIPNRQTITEVTSQVQDNIIPGLNYAEDINLTHVTDDNNKKVDISNRQIITVNTYQVQDNSTYCGNAEKHIEVIDITADSDTENVTVTNKGNICVEHVNTGISNMTLQDQLRCHTESDNYTCSQSILDNFEYITKEKEGTNEVEMVILSNDNIKIPLPVIKSQATIAYPKLDVEQGNKLNCQENANKTENKVINKKENNKKRIRTKKNKAATVDSSYTNSKNIISDNKENYPKNAKKPKKRKNVQEIYNENVENDLSWVENLRFVREISSSEHDPSLTMLEDNFWNNFHLPGTWDELDFNV